MGLFGYLGDVVSGNNYKRNTLLVDNLNLFGDRTERFKNKKAPKFVENWCLSCSAAAYKFLDFILFEAKNIERIDLKWIQPFREHINRLTVRSACDMFKVLACHNLALALSNKDFINFLKDHGINLVEFKTNNFDVFSFADAEKNLYKQLVELHKYDSAEEIYRTIRSQLFNKGYGISLEAEKELIANSSFSAYLGEVFTKTCSKCLNRLEPNLYF